MEDYEKPYCATEALDKLIAKGKAAELLKDFILTQKPLSDDHCNLETLFKDLLKY